MGALVAMSCLNANPSAATTLTLVGPAGLNPAPDAQKLLADDDKADEFARNFGQQIFDQHQSHNVRDPQHAALLDAIIRDAYRYEGSLFAFFDTLQHFELFDRAELYERTSTLPVPVMLMWGTDDEVTPISSLNEVRTLLQPEQCHVVDDCGHMVPFERPELVAHALADFIFTHTDRLRPMATTSTTDVLIVGAGATGTTLAIDLTRRGIRVRLIDKEPHALNGSLAKGIQPRTLEVLEDLGTVAAILDGDILYPKMGIHVGPATIPKRMIEKGDPSPDIPYPDTWLIPQNTTIRILHDRLESLGTRIELGTELLDFTTTGTGVVARLKGDDGIEEITASFLVGADGASSHVRKGAGIDFEGTTDDADRMLIVDAVVDGGLSRKYWTPARPGWIRRSLPATAFRALPMDDQTRPQRNTTVHRRRDQYAVRSRTGNKKLALRDIAWQSVFRPNIRLASHYRRGPVLVAGDAASPHSRRCSRPEHWDRRRIQPRLETRPSPRRCSRCSAGQLRDRTPTDCGCRAGPFDEEVSRHGQARPEERQAR